MRTLGEWFAKASGGYTVEAKRRFVACHALREGILFSMYAVVGGAFVAFLCFMAVMSGTAMPETFIGIAPMLIVLGAGSAGIVRAVTALRALRRSRREMEAAFRREPPTGGNASAPTHQ
jgi:hypothetical protein